MTKDPFTEVIANPYTYASNLPTSRVDPSGAKDIETGDPEHPEKKITLTGCRTLKEVQTEHDQNYGPVASLKGTDIICCALKVRKAWNSPMVKSCCNMLNSPSSTACGTAAKNPPSCDEKCQYLGLYYEGSNTINICVSPTLKASDAELQLTICHELIHAWQSKYCQGANDPVFHGPDPCLNSLKKEFQAYLCEGACQGFKDCLNQRGGARAQFLARLDCSATPSFRTVYFWYLNLRDKQLFCPPGSPKGPPNPGPWPPLPWPPKLQPE